MKGSRMVCLSVAFALCVSMAAQGQTDPQKQEKEFYEAIQEQVEKQTLSLGLSYWQEFKLDSLLTHDYKAMQEELEELRRTKVSNSDLYYRVQDKWMENIYEGYRSFLSDEQWAKYLKKGAAGEKKARDKRMAKYR